MMPFLAILSRIPLLAYPLAFVSLLWLGSRVEVHHLKNAVIVEQAKRDRAVSEANAKAYASAAELEKLKATRAAKTVYITKKVKDALQTDSSWAERPIPSSMLDAFTAARAVVDPTQPDGTLQPAGPLSTDEWRFGGSLRPSPGFLGRLFGPAEGSSSSPTKVRQP